jgi:hypothetical protein
MTGVRLAHTVTVYHTVVHPLSDYTICREHVTQRLASCSPPVLVPVISNYLRKPPVTHNSIDSTVEPFNLNGLAALLNSMETLAFPKLCGSMMLWQSSR